MATIKSFTDIPQSKKLAEFLPLESADMYYINGSVGKIHIGGWKDEMHDEDDLPCWSLDALLSVLPLPSLIQDKADDELFWQCSAYDKDGTLLCETYDYNNSIDACYKLILELHERKML